MSTFDGEAVIEQAAKIIFRQIHVQRSPDGCEGGIHNHRQELPC